MNILKSLKEKLESLRQPELDEVNLELVEGEGVVLPDLPCPLNHQMFKSCVCITCIHASSCPMELQCRKEGCERAFIAGCTNYTNTEEEYAEEKREIFKSGRAYEPSVFRFGSSASKENIRL